MRFAIDRISLWLHNGRRRDIELVPGKVNVITGDSNTGKSAILQIFDYCFFSSESSISESVINENVAWYGLELKLNGKALVLARQSPTGRQVSSGYFFSTVGASPLVPKVNISESDLKRIVEVEFGIGEKTTTPFGGRAIRAGSKLSLRYFLLFNTISEDIITSSGVFFDRQDQERYREALPRIFDLALGIDSVANILTRERRIGLEGELVRLIRKEAQAVDRHDEFRSEATELSRRAIAFGLAPEALAEQPFDALRSTIANSGAVLPEWQGAHDELSAELLLINRKIRGLKRFAEEYQRYKEHLRTVGDSLRPVEALRERAGGLVQTPHFDELLHGFKEDLLKMKEAVRRGNPVEGGLQDLLRSYEQGQADIASRLEAFPASPESLASEREKWMFVGEVKGKLDAYAQEKDDSARSYKEEIARVEQEIGQLHVVDIEERRDTIVRLIERFSIDALAPAIDALENYRDYVIGFSYKDKRIQLRHPRSMIVENVGSSSNHMFLHLTQFLALHEVAISQASPYVAPILFIDQPSRPYYGDETEEKKGLAQSDSGKIAAAFRMLDEYLSRLRERYGAEFQIIVLEHVPPSIWAGLPNVHLVETFAEGNALVPRGLLQ